MFQTLIINFSFLGFISFLWQNSKGLLAVNYFCKENSIIDIWLGTNWASEMILGIFSKFRF